MNKEEGNKGESISLSELDDKLMADKDGSYKQSLLDKIKPYRENLNEEIEKGEFAPEEFEAAKKMLEGLKKAEDILRDR